MTTDPYRTNPERLYFALQRTWLLETALETLTYPQAWVILQRFYNGRTLLQVAFRRGIEINAVSETYGVALETLRQGMENCGVFSFRDIWFSDE